MTLSDIRFANFTLDELIKDKPFFLSFDANDRESLKDILMMTQVEQEYSYELLHQLRDCKEDLMHYEINKDNADRIYNVLASFLVVNKKEINAMQSLGEVS